MKPRDLLFMVGICLVWAANAIACRFAIAGLGGAAAPLRGDAFVVAATVLLPRLSPRPRPRLPVISIGPLVGAGRFGFLFAGFRIVEPSTVAIVLQVGIPLTVILSRFALALLGVGIVPWTPRSLFSRDGASPVVAAGCSLALGSVSLERMRDIDPLRMQAWTSAASVLPLAATSAPSSRSRGN